MDILVKHREVEFSDCGSDNRLLPYKASEYIENATTKYLKCNTLDNNSLSEAEHVVFVVLKSEQNYLKTLYCGDEIDITVKAVNKNAMSFVLRADVTRNDELCITSFVEIAGIDVASRTVAEIKYIISGMKIYEGYKPTERIRPLKYESLPYKEMEAMSVDIDFNRHLNNVSYIRYAYSILSSEEIGALYLKKASIVYVHEILEKDKIRIYYDSSKENFVFVRDNLICARMKLTKEE